MLQHLLPRNPFRDREGSLKDVQNLKDTFNCLKFTVVEIHDIYSYHFKSEIQSIIKNNFFKNVHSVLFMCILSHGAKGTLILVIILFL